jgi:hypothetical protein
MNSRILSGILAIVGAVIVAIGCYVPMAGSGKYAFRIFDTNAPHAILWFAVEPAAVIVAAVVIGILLILASYRWMAGALLAMGVQVALMFAGYIGYYTHTNFGSHVHSGGWIGILGGVVIAAAGGVALVATSGISTAPAPVAAPLEATQITAAGWYADPNNATLLRYWSGGEWTSHTHSVQPPATPVPTPAVSPSPAPPDQPAPPTPADGGDQR